MEGNIADKDYPLETSVKMNNDPWKPLERTNVDIPKIIPAPQDPLKNMISSDSYVKSLEKKLSKLKGKSDKVKPKDMIQSLHEARDLHSSQYIADDSINTQNEDFLTDNNEQSVISSLQRRLNPERQALNTLELTPLVQEDVLAKLTEELDDSKEKEELISVEKT